MEQENNKILVIDDELGPRESLRYLLNKDYLVRCAVGVDEGIGLLHEFEPDLIIMDITMPGKTGIQGLEEIRRTNKTVPVIMLTGYGTLDTAQQALRLGASDYISKPFDLSEMRKLVEKHLDLSSYQNRRISLLTGLKEMNSKLVEELASKDRMAALGESSAEFAHDLRNPLMIINGYVDLLAKQFSRSNVESNDAFQEMKSYIEAIEESVRRCCKLTEMWSHAEQGNEAIVTEAFEVQELIKHLEKAVAPIACVAEVKVEFNTIVPETRMTGDMSQLLRALHNVVNNAIDAVKPGTGKISINVSKRGSDLTIDVIDNGCGMPKEVLDHMFDPYYTTKGREKGTGLGTVITRKIVEQHKGSIEVSSAPGQGTSVTLVLPSEQAPSPVVIDDVAEVRFITPPNQKIRKIPGPDDRSNYRIQAMTPSVEHAPLPRAKGRLTLQV